MDRLQHCRCIFTFIYLVDKRTPIAQVRWGGHQRCPRPGLHQHDVNINVYDNQEPEFPARRATDEEGEGLPLVYLPSSAMPPQWHGEVPPQVTLFSGGVIVSATAKDVSRKGAPSREVYQSTSVHSQALLTRYDPILSENNM